MPKTTTSASTSRRKRQTSSTLARAAKKATASASKRAFAQHKTQLVVRDGWLVRINKNGRVTKRVEQLTDRSSLVD